MIFTDEIEESKTGVQLPVKLEIVEDFLEEENGPANKRSKLWSNGTSVSLIPPNLLDEPSPLGLSLRKSPSLQDLIQMRLSQSVKKETIANASSLVGTVEKLKASNFPATVLRIGQWEPRKHTLWQATSDFTDGQASMNRQHFLQCLPGILNKHIEKLLQCDHRLFCLSQEPEMNFDTLFSDTRQSIFEDPSVSGAQSSSEHMSLSHDALSPSSVMDARAIEGGVGARNWNQIHTIYLDERLPCVSVGSS
ncbi:hypothetical protein HID58_095870 [Brassica napus]|uniref:TRF2/HOY1 PH-like domain-containing protein n=1 Tax=Brassica napus TaxID=3708 RepID=A0ABQ7X269_BRANA|nr:hypothetical protein HID58_095870 [Brassica napus]